MKSRSLLIIALLLIILLLSCAFRFDINNGDKVTIFNNGVVPAGDIVSGDAVTIFGNLEINGAVRGDVVTVFGNVDIYGEANGDIVAVFGNINVHKDAIIGGDAVGVLGNVTKDPGSRIGGEIVDTKAGFMPARIDFIPNMSFGSVIGAMILYGLCCLVVAIIPDRVRLMVQSSQFGLGRKLGIGLLVMLILILLIPILIITVIGIIPAILLILAFLLVMLVSTTAIYIALGQRIAAAVEGKNSVYIHLLIGLVVIHALQIIPIVGVLASIAVFFIGLGVAFDTRLGGPILKKKAI